MKRKERQINKLSQNSIAIEYVQLINNNFKIIDKPIYRMICVESLNSENINDIILDMIKYIKDNGIHKISKNYELEVIYTEAFINKVQLKFKF